MLQALEDFAARKHQVDGAVLTNAFLEEKAVPFFVAYLQQGLKRNTINIYNILICAFVWCIPNNIHNSLTLQNFWSKNKLKTALLEEIILRDSASLAHPVCLILYKASALPHGCVPITTLPTFSPDFQLDIQLSAIDMVCCCLGVVGVLL